MLILMQEDKNVGDLTRTKPILILSHTYTTDGCNLNNTTPMLVICYFATFLVDIHTIVLVLFNFIFFFKAQ